MCSAKLSQLHAGSVLVASAMGVSSIPSKPVQGFEYRVLVDVSRAGKHYQDDGGTSAI